MRVAVVGAGIAGLAAARRLAAERGHEVVVFDKGRSVGGRLATRRIGAATVDHGAQFFTARGEALQAQTGDWLSRGVARVWCHGFHGREDGHPRHIGTGGMNSLAKDLAAGLDCRCNSLVFTLRHGTAGWEVVTDDGAAWSADAVVLTCPVPQSRALLAQSEAELPDDLAGTDYERTIALLAVLDRPSAVPAPGGVQFGPGDLDGPFAFVADNHAKGVSAVPALTLHATPSWSAARWGEPTSEVRTELLALARPWLGAAGVVATQVKKWRFATPSRQWPDPCWVDPDLRVVLAGDAFAGPRVEGAFESGIAAAAALSGHR